MQQTASAARLWETPVGGVPLRALRAQAREEALRLSMRTCERLGISWAQPIQPTAPIVMTGHQPELFHPGVWAKHFAVQRYVDEHGGNALDLVVDSDRSGTLALRMPCVRERVRRHDVVLADGGDACYACVPAPSRDAVERFVREAVVCAETLPVAGPGERLAHFAGCVRDAASRTANLAETVVAARRAYERPAGTTYGEVFVSEQSATPGFLTFAAHLVCEAERFAELFNEEVKAYRARWRVRSAAHPFPELQVEGGVAEVPLWALVDGARRAIAFEPDDGLLHVEGSGTLRAGSAPREIIRAVADSGLKIVPRAVSLTMFQRLCVADLFVHGIGGSKYEVITDRVIERWLGISPPPYAVVSLTMRLPVGVASSSEEELSALRHALHVAKHNPDKLLKEAWTGAPLDQDAIEKLVERKQQLVAEAAAPGADKRAIGEAIREVNAKLRTAIEPLVSEIEQRIERLEASRQEHEAFSDRECSFPLFDPLEVAEAVG